MADYWPGTVAGLLAQAQFELNRTDFTVNEVSSVLNGVIAQANQEPFWFNQVALTPSTVASQEYYTSSDLAAIAELHSIESVVITVSSSRYPLRKRTQIELDELAVTASHTGRPTDYSYYNKQLRLFPVPDAVYTLTIRATEDYTALDEATDTNDWLSNKLPYMFCLHKTCSHAYKFWIHQPEKVMIRENEAEMVLEKMRMETTRREAGTRIRASACL